MDRCFTLVLTFTDDKKEPVEFDPVQANFWIQAFFGADSDKVWMEKPAGSKKPRCGHLFACEQWRPIHMPNRETERELTERELTERGLATLRV